MILFVVLTLEGWPRIKTMVLVAVIRVRKKLSNAIYLLHIAVWTEYAGRFWRSY